MQGTFGNTSGQGALSTVPPEINRFNWGALLLNWIWGIFNLSCGFAILSFVLGLIPLVNLVWAIVLGFKGNEWSWRARSWPSVQHFLNTQRKWMIAGVAILVVSIVLGCLFGVLGGALGASQGAMPQ